MKASLFSVFVVAFALTFCGCDSETTDNSSTPSNPSSNESKSVIDTDTTWTADEEHFLTELTFVTNNATLTIEAGTVVQGDNGSALIVTKGAQLVTNGTAEAPVVFTSSLPEGERRAGDWGGVVLLGNAPTNIGEGNIEGLEADDTRGQFGGDDETHKCGSLTYTRIEFAGFELSTDNELNGLTLGGCGSQTTLDYIQVHQGKDDGIEFFGGSAQASHLVLTSIQDDSVDWDQGFNGQIQFLVVQQNPSDADNSFEADNNKDDNDLMPRSAPTIANATLVGTGKDSQGAQNGMVLRRGTHATLSNFIVMGFPNNGIDVRDESTTQGVSLTNSLFFDNTHHFDADDDDKGDDDAGFNEAEIFGAAETGNVLDQDPLLGAPYDLNAPNFVPQAGSPVADAPAPEGEGFDASATYMGAFASEGDDWTAGWTAYPEN